MVLPDSHGISRAPCYLGSPSGGRTISSTGVTPSVPGLSRPFDYDTTFSLPASSAEPAERSHNPAHATPAGYHTRTVWPDPLSLATTHGISLPVGTEMFHFPTFPLPALYIQAGVTRSARRPAGFPHSDTLGSKLAYQFPEAYRRLLRPSSAPDAKASTVCS